MGNIDLHVHTTLSDGMHSPEAVVAEAKQCGISALAITDHNCTMDLKQLRDKNTDLFLIQGSEISCIYTDSNGVEHEIHVVALGFDPQNSKMQNIFIRNQPDRKAYIEAILDRLGNCGVHIGSYSQLVNDYPESCHVGRSHIANKMYRCGYVHTAEEAFDEYIGDFGKRRAYVESKLRYVSLEECIESILSANGIAILAHLFYYRLDHESNCALVKYFKALTGKQGGIETSYSRYSESQRKYLRDIANEYGLLHSAGSDYHGKDASETMNCNFSYSDFRPLMEALKNKKTL